MKIIYSEKHKLRDAKTELHGGELVKPFEGPFRAEWILEAVQSAGFKDVSAPADYNLDVAMKVHDRGYLEFLATAWDRWAAEGFAGEAIPVTLPVRRTQMARVPRNIDGALGYYANSVETSISKGTYEAVLSSQSSALEGADWLNKGNRSAFALCRPPGHHAGIDTYGGYCFINNAAVAAQRLLDHGAKRVAILDVDFHHGNGTQDITYRRDDIFFASLHGDPVDAFPTSSAMPTRPAKGRAKASTRIIRCRRAHPGAHGRRRSPMRLPASRPMAQKPLSCRWASIRSRRIRSASSS